MSENATERTICLIREDQTRLILEFLRDRKTASDWVCHVAVAAAIEREFGPKDPA